ncbi:trifunctional serine/threonine-protein kinase/ATP-binding protein/sensor histidine kinase [Calothrix sp. NIES-2098]|uniref:trifunctional serine/threonine-protein kinase/ATP-binding protein/sensor histidine kinase n=1 Tax=Calothrix sp. NIES-2098 TaxID=1954171 RepID=UPI000B5E5702|nr:serine/threonine protein kinase with two-component sensor domain [Calothrix sp. NIES-2098]
MLIIPGYQFNEELYNGSRTLVYRGYREIDEKPVAIKLLKNPYPSFSELVQFRNQYTIAKNLHQPGIIQTYSLEPYQNGYALVMEDFGGISLKEYFTFGSLQEFLQIAIALCDILDTLYRDRIIHKDIKPSNILINPQTKQVKLIDFSIASLLPRETQTLIGTNILEGTLAYISPEQTGRMNRGIDYRTDFYSLGVTFYELLTAELPFQSHDAMELVHCHIAKMPPLLREVKSEEIPQVISDIVMKLMAKNAEDRYQSALGLKFDLENCLVQLQETGEIKSFPIAQRDVCDRFIIPEKLYGREQEVETLLAAFDRVAHGATEIMLVAGFSGIGKTAVVNEVHKPIVRQRGYFIKGKFDQFNRNIPFSAFVQAFRDLMGQLLTESDRQIQQWQNHITQALGDNAQVIIDVIPELELIIGKQPPVPEVSGIAAQNRFNLLLQKFIKLFTDKEHLLVIFLDDLQWIDSASLKLMQSLISEANYGYLLLIGAYRDNEVSAAHPLMMTLDDIQERGAKINTIILKPLNEFKLNQLVADTLDCTEKLALPLSQLIYQKTQGNPFFATQFIKVLHQDALIYFNYEQRYWQCDIAAINQRSLTSDVVEFMALQLQKLPELTQNVLKLAACIGNKFDLETLAIVSKQSKIETAACLWSALQDGLILPQNEVYKFYQESEFKIENSQEQRNPADFWLMAPDSCSYKFLHDRIQQAAYSLIPENQKQATHYHIGKLLLGNLSTAELEERIFDVVNQINIGKCLLQYESEKKQLAELNLSAGQKAKASTAYEAAKTYLQVGINLLVKDAWTATYRLAFDLHFNLAEAALMSGDFQSFDETVLILLEFANSNIDRAKIYVLKVDRYSLQGQFAEAIQAGLAGLQNLGITIDRDTLRQLTQDEFAIVEDSLKNRSIASLLDLPAAKNPEVQAAIELLIILQPPAYIVSDFDLYSFATFRGVRLSIEQGNTAESIKAYATYGFLIGLMYGQHQRGLEFADLALQLSYQLNSKFQQSRACFILGCAIQVWAKPIQGAPETNYQGFLAGLESGEIIHAGYNLYGNILNRLFQGENLADIAIDIDKYWLIGEQFKHDFLLSILSACRFFVNQLSQSLDEQEQTLATAEQAWVERSEALQSYTALGTYYILQMHRACLIPGFKPDIDYITGARKFLKGCAGFTTSSGYYYYTSLLLCYHYPNLSESQRSDVLQQIETNQAQLKIWSESCSENFLHKYLLVEAERSRIVGKCLEAQELYDRAIAEAKVNGYLQEEALANELAAKFYFNWGKEKAAQGYMQEAYYCYARWGAKAKTEELEKRYPVLLKPIQQQRRFNFNSLETIATIAQTSNSHSTSITDALNFSSVLKAAQTISSTIELDRLVASLTQIIVENSGAKKSALILPSEQGTWQVTAITWIDRQVNSQGGIQTTIQPQPIDTCQEIPTTIINYVKNTQQTIIIDNCKTEIPGIIGEYMHATQPKSVLCTPIIHQGHLVGILYLENQLTTGVFDSDRLEIIQMLSAQAAISLENARLYRESQVKAQQLQQSLQQQKTLFHVVTQIRESLELDAIFRAVTQNIRQILNADRVGIYQFHLGENYEYGELIAEDVLPEFTSGLAVKVHDRCFGDNFARLYKQGRICAIDDVNTDAVKDCHRAILAQFQVRASLVVPIMQNDELWGLLCIHQCDRPRHWQASEIQFAQQIGAQMGVALQQTDLLLATQKQATQLEQTLQHLQQTQLQLVQHEKMSALGNLVSGVAHEMNNPLGFIAASLEQTKPALADIVEHLKLYQASLANPDDKILDHAKKIDLDYSLADLPKVIDAMVMACDRLKNISTSLRTFSRADKDYKVPFNIHEGIDSTILILKHRLKANNQRPAIVITNEYSNLPKIECFPGQLNQVFMNIIANAIDALDEANIGQKFADIEANPNHIKITTSVTDNQVKITIADNGKGMSQEVKQKIFDHLFTTKEVGKGTGLGLAIARQIVEETHNGKLICHSVVGKGTEFIIQLPL